MTKQEYISEIKSLLVNDYGDHGVSNIADQLIRLPESAMRSANIEQTWNNAQIYEVFRSDTESGVAVANYKNQVVDCAQLTCRTLYLIHRALFSVRAPFKIY